MPDALAELTAQAKSAKPELAKLLRNIRDRLKLQDRTADTIGAGLQKTLRAVVDALRDLLAGAPGATVAEQARRLGVNARFLTDLLGQLGLTDLIDEVMTAQADLANLGAAAQQAGGLPVATRVVNGAVVAQASASAIAAATDDFVSRFWEARIIVPTTERLLDGLRSSMVGESLDAVAERLQRSMQSSVPAAVTEARTRIAEFDRAAVAQTAAEAGATLYLYLGPLDGITRGFCAQLHDLVLTAEQVARLDNAQTATSPLFSGGGYNCRHQFSPVTPALVQGLGVNMATDEDIDRANARARASR